MAVYIPSMKMPTSCMDCPFRGFDRARGRGNICTINESITLHAVLDGLDVKFVLMGDCPLIPVPAHGRLIDGDSFENFIRKDWDKHDHWIADVVYSRPTIIPASEEGE